MLSRLIRGAQAPRLRSRFWPPLLSACNDRRRSRAKRAAFVRTEIVQPRDRQASVTLTGEVQARFRADLSFRVSGRVLERLVDVGAHVNAGDVLARLDPAEQQADLDAATAAVAAAESQLRVAQATFDRQKALIAKRFTTRVAYDQAQEALRNAESTLELAKAQLGTAKDALGYTELRAGAAGVITARNLEVGQVVQAAQPVFTLAQDGDRDAVFDVLSPFSLAISMAAAVSLALVSDPDVTATRLCQGSIAGRRSEELDGPGQSGDPKSAGSDDAWQRRGGNGQSEARQRDHVAVDRTDGDGIKARGLDRRPRDQDCVAEAGDDRRLRSRSGADQGRARAWRARRCRWRQAAQLRPARDL